MKNFLVKKGDESIGVSIKEAMSIGGLSKCEVVAGVQGLDREIKYVTVMEVPDVIQWLKGQDLLLTSLYPIKDDPIAIGNLVKQLNEKGSSALAIKTHRFIDGIPEEIIHEANRLNFPIIEVKQEVSYLDIINPLMNAILEVDSPNLDDYEELYQWITELALAGKGLDTILDALSKLIENKITIESKIPYVEENACPEDLSPLNTKQINELRKSKRPLRMVRKLDGRNIPCIVSPLILNEEINAYITCWETKRGFRKNDFKILERVTLLFALEFQKVKTKIDIEKKYRNEFLSEILLGNIRKEKEIIEKAKIYGWDLTKDFQVMVLDVDGFASIVERYGYNELKIQEFKRNMEGNIERAIHISEKSAIVSLSSDKIVILYPVMAQDETRLKDQLVEIAEHLKNRLEKQVDEVTFTIGIGRFYPGIKGIHHAYKEAIQSIQLGRKAWGRNRIIHFDTLGIYRILSQFHNHLELESIYQETIGKLVVYDENHSSNLTETLVNYFRYECSLTDTAEKMFIHVNTLKYRLQKIEQISGKSVNHSEDRFNLHLGLKIKDLKDVNTQWD